MKRLASLLALALGFAPAAAQTAAESSYRDRLPEDEVIYFVLPDRFENGNPKNDKGGLMGDRYKTGFDPAHKGFYHGGDLQGLTNRLDYIQDMGITAIWFAPIFKNKPVQGGPGNESAGYHGYWVTDFTSVDPHFGTNDEFRHFVDAAHARGMKVYMDIIANHTADVIQYKECPASSCAYRQRADYPYSLRASDGAAINPGFLGDAVQTPENFAKLNGMDFAYTPVIPKGEETVKVPAWLNDIRWYHNRGDSTFQGESSTMGDFVGLDGVMTENPRVVSGFVDIYGDWIDRFGVDGFRVDTARHVNPEFWQAFVPAMLDRAKAKGIPNFHIFGEIGGVGLEPGKLAVHTRVDGFPAVIDFAFRQATIDALSGSAGTDKLWELLFQDPLYEGGADKARIQPTFISNHDNGRFAYFIRKALPGASDDEVLARVRLGHALLLTMRGVPTIYSGDEQGFAGDGWDQDSREDMFPSKVAVYNDNILLGTKATTAQSNFDTGHVLYKSFSKLAKLRVQNAALRRGRTLVRNYSDKPGLFAFSRIDDTSGSEILVVANTSAEPLTANIELDVKSSSLSTLDGTCPVAPRAPGSVSITLKPLDYMVCLVK
jgi:glycosidase